MRYLDGRRCGRDTETTSKDPAEARIVTAVVLAVVAVAGFIMHRLRRASRTLRAADTPTQPGPPPAAPDNQPGTDLFDLDTCRRILRATEELEAECARLWDAITEHRKEEEA